jgi:hypothetical protein
MSKIEIDMKWHITETETVCGVRSKKKLHEYMTDEFMKKGSSVFKCLLNLSR